MKNSQFFLHNHLTIFSLLRVVNFRFFVILFIIFLHLMKIYIFLDLLILFYIVWHFWKISAVFNFLIFIGILFGIFLIGMWFFLACFSWFSSANRLWQFLGFLGTSEQPQVLCFGKSLQETPHLASLNQLPTLVLS